MFRDVKVGDRVWDVQHGWGVVEEVGTDYFEVLFVEPALDGDRVDGAYLLDGRPHARVRNPTLFWDEIVIKAPEKPVRLVERTFEGWVNLYNYQPPYFHESRDKAKDFIASGGIGAFAVTVTLHGVPEGTNLGVVQGLGDINEIS